MSDFLEFVTSSDELLRFYRISCDAISFSVKCVRRYGPTHFALFPDAKKPAAVGLSREPGESCDYWIMLKPNQCWLEKNGSPLGTVKEIPNILNGNEYSNYWISWYNTRIQFGRTEDGIPLISKRIPVRDKIQFVSFVTLCGREIIQWKIHGSCLVTVHTHFVGLDQLIPPLHCNPQKHNWALANKVIVQVDTCQQNDPRDLRVPPSIEKPLIKKVTGGEMYWVEVDEQIPDGALIGGYENEILYIIRAYHESSLIPNKFVPSQRSGYISFSQQIHEKKKFEILCGHNCFWVSGNRNMIPVAAVEGGYDSIANEKLYIGRAYVDGNLLPGKIQPSLAACCVTHSTGEVWKGQYEILINLHSITNISDTEFPQPNDYVVALNVTKTNLDCALDCAG